MAGGDRFSIQEQLRDRNVQRFRGGLVFKAHRLLYQSTLGLRVTKKKKKKKKKKETTPYQHSRPQGLLLESSKTPD